MASLTRSESFTLPARATAVFLIGGAGSVTVDGSTSALGNQDVRLGPFTTAKTVSVSVTSGTVRYRLETVQAAPVLVTNDGDLVKPDGAGAGVSGGGGSTTVVDNLNSNSTSSALSANQGRVLAEGKVDKISASTPRSVVIPSGVAWLNTGTAARTVNVSGGTVSAVSLATAAAPTNYVQQGTTSGNFTVQPGGQIKIDWSVQPTVTIS